MPSNRAMDGNILNTSTHWPLHATYAHRRSRRVLGRRDWILARQTIKTYINPYQ